ncbi:MAG: protein O-mannosyl-transferase family [Friedmanniella sp.]
MRQVVGAPLLRRAWPALVPALVLAVIYGATVQRSTGNTFSLDTTKFEYVGRVLGTPHPPGYPLYTVLNAAFVQLVPVGSVALRANLLSAVFALLACVAAVSVLRDLGLPPALQAGGATTLGLLPAFWDDAVVAEVYSLTALFMVGVLACILRYERSGRPGWLRAGLLLFALSFAHATSHVLLIPGLLLYLALRWPRWLLRPRELLTLLPAGALLALLPYAYLPWRTAVAGDTWLETRVFDRHSLWAAMTGAQFGDRMFVLPWEVVRSERLPALAVAAFGQLGPLVVLAAVGLLALAWQRPLVAVLTLSWVLGTGWFVLTYLVDDWLTLLLPVWLVLGIWTLVGIHRCVAATGRRSASVAAVVAVALPLAALLHGYPHVSRRGSDPQRDVDAAVAAVPDGSLVFTGSLEARQQFVYRLLPDGYGLQHRVWVAEGSDHSRNPDAAVFWLRTYCTPSTRPWEWPWHELPASPSVARGLRTFVYGDGYADEVTAQGLQVRHVDGQLYAVSCPQPVPEASPDARPAAVSR